MRPDPSSLREALARTLTNQRREPDQLVDEVIYVLRQYGREGWLADNHETWWVRAEMVADEHYVRVLVIPLPDAS